MDRDIRIIEAVREKPCLYVDSFNMEERDRGWKQLSERLKIKDQILKIRWHLLVQRYQSDGSFKYAQQMNFVERKTKINGRNGSWPEFEITEEDVLEARGNSDEYVFLDVDDLEDNSSTDLTSDAVKEENCVESTDISSTDVPDPVTTVDNGAKECEKNANKLDEIKEPIVKSLSELSTVQRNSIAPEASSNMIENSSKIESIKPTPERCEDDIFGELVAAMLKRMDADKKRMLKKEIMNTLLT